VQRGVGGSLDLGTTLRGPGQAAIPTLADWCVLDVVGEEGDLRSGGHRASILAQEPLLADLNTSIRPAPTRHSPRRV
jgi:hypothetical protein